NGVTPSNTDQGYVLRRLIRRAIVHGRKLGIEGDFVRKISGIYVKNYGEYYTELLENQEKIFEEMMKEETQFNKTIVKGESVLRKQIVEMKVVPDDLCFEMFTTYGYPVEMTIEELEHSGLVEGADQKAALMEGFEKRFKAHQELSRAGAEKKFAGGLADHSEETTRLHTATHLLHQALKTVLGDHVTQRGSNITVDRLRFDFNHPEKMTPEQKEEVEKIVNEQIKRALPISCEEMSVDEAKAKGAIGLFESKYGDTVKVYMMGDFSMEICGGPHVENTSELGSFRIKKEESSSSGVRRIKATVTGA
ncbi:alanine--tRNA ligase, partial [Candidatus Gracilibacteria bacterium]|nr:alanine--tRNA ligase [Candidatus Gracilibacteria bacterium]